MDYIVGVDGGGSKTAGLLVDREGHALAREVVGPTNYQIVGAAGIRGEISRLVHRLFAGAHVPEQELASMALGLAGVGRPGEPERVAQVVEGLRLARSVVVDHDAMIALVGALGDTPGLIVIAGTGSIALGRNALGQRARAGGWGYLVGDEGGGFFVAREALVAILKAHDGRGEGTQMTERILGKLELRSVEEIIPRVYRQGMSHDEMATLAPLVFETARRGDTVARAIVQRAGRELGLMAAAVINRLGIKGTVPIGLVGSLFKDKELLLGSMRDALGEKITAEFLEPRLDPVGGAALLALKETGVSIGPSVLKTLQESISHLKRGGKKAEK
jgi:N-acetylglucosamine kinase